VGLDISKDGSIVITTSQGRKNAGGGNAVNIFRVSYAEPEPQPEQYVDESLEEDTAIEDRMDNQETDDSLTEHPDKDENDYILWIIAGGIALIILIMIISHFIRRKK